MSVFTDCGDTTTVDSTSDKELVISTYFPSLYLENVVKQFGKQHPDVDVKIEAFQQIGAAIQVGEDVETRF